MNQSEIEYQQELRHEMYEDVAREEFYQRANKIAIALQHYVVDGMVDIDHVRKVANAIRTIENFGVWFEYTTEDGEEFVYDFEKEALEFLQDEFGWVRPSKRGK